MPCKKQLAGEGVFAGTDTGTTASGVEETANSVSILVIFGDGRCAECDRLAAVPSIKRLATAGERRRLVEAGDARAGEAVDGLWLERCVEWALLAAVPFDRRL